MPSDDLRAAISDNQQLLDAAETLASWFRGADMVALGGALENGDNGDIFRALNIDPADAEDVLLFLHQTAREMAETFPEIAQAASFLGAEV